MKTYFIKPVSSQYCLVFGIELCDMKLIKGCAISEGMQSRSVCKLRVVQYHSVSTRVPFFMGKAPNLVWRFIVRF